MALGDLGGRTSTRARSDVSDAAATDGLSLGALERRRRTCQDIVAKGSVVPTNLVPFDAGLSSSDGGAQVRITACSDRTSGLPGGRSATDVSSATPAGGLLGGGCEVGEGSEWGEYNSD